MAQELNIRLSADEGTPLYRQIYTYIRDEIRRGSLEADERLPSTRALAAGLHVARSTAELAYSQLLSEGYIRAKRNSGYYVNEIENLQDLHFGGADTDAEEEEKGEKESGQGKGHPLPCPLSGPGHRQILFRFPCRRSSRRFGAGGLPREGGAAYEVGQIMDNG